MIKLNNIQNNISLELYITGYQFPDIKNDDWCLLKVIVSQEGNTSEIIDPALEAAELACILEWFKSLSCHKLPKFARLNFTEPCIEFEFLSGSENSVRISVNLSHEIKPSFKLIQFGESSDNWEIVFDLEEKDFESIISGLELVVKEYPVRDTES